MLPALQLSSVQVKSGDILVAATDGVWDNMYSPDINSLVTTASTQGQSPAQVAENLARFAHMR